MTESKRQMMMTDIVDILVSYDSNIDDLLICAEKMYISAAGQLANQLASSEEGWKGKMKKFAKLVSERLHEKLLARIETEDGNEMVSN